MEQLGGSVQQAVWRRRAVGFHRAYRFRFLFVVLCAVARGSAGQAPEDSEGPPIHVNGVFPNLTVMAKGTGSTPRRESGR